MSKKRSKKQKEDAHVDESWLLPYADLLTLLLALFIVLFAISSVDAQKFQALSKAFNATFEGGTGVLEFQTPPTPKEENLPAEDPTEKNVARDSGMDPSEKEGEKPLTEEQKQKIAHDADQQELLTVQQKVNAYMEENGIEDKLQTSLTDEGLLISIRDNVFFASGRADVRPEDIRLAKEISNLLVMDPPRNIIISGHTDNVPIRNAGFQSNWELSVMRAINFMKVILENNRLNPSMFSAKGFGEFKPVASNDTEEGKKKNRRVEILITPRTTTAENE
ncbi:flagellar motor protein MotB [Priestia flexa]|uniref:flagellar motor protein MotB n=1 Tax=Priestia flexa TaxID=86664 RepID=UPI00240D6709|nr:flagellar motor protein MotB [Priestia flexa]WEZ07431.1 flagellar motor protein MotB [Priestia flexa]